MKAKIFFASSMVALSMGPIGAQETGNGVVLCYANAGDAFGGGHISGQRDAYNEAAHLLPTGGLGASFLGIPGAEQRHLMSFRGEGGYIFCDRGVALGGQFEVGVTGRLRMEWLAEAAVGCDFVMETDVCVFRENQDFSVSCESSDALPPEVSSDAPEAVLAEPEAPVGGVSIDTK